jgi:hypothetical protein
MLIELWGTPIEFNRLRKESPYQRETDKVVAQAKREQREQDLEEMGTELLAKARRADANGKSSLDHAIVEMLQDIDSPLMTENVGAIVGNELRNGAWHIVETVKFRVLAIVRRNIHKWAKKANPGGYTMRAIKEDARREYGAVMEELIVAKMKGLPTAKIAPRMMHSKHLHPFDHLVSNGLEINAKLYNDWIPHAETEAEVTALKTLYALDLKRSDKRRVGRVRDKLLDHCAEASGLTRAETLALFKRVAWLTIPESYDALAIDMETYKSRRESPGLVLA